MAIQIQGNGGTIAEVDSSFRAQRTSLRPIDPSTLGAYRIAVQTGVMAAGLAASAEIFQFRWTDATRLCCIERIAFDGMGTIAAFTAGTTIFRATVARSWTVDGSGGTTITLTGNNQKQRTSFGTSLVGSARVASTGALTAGTKTLDAQDFGQAVSSLTVTAGTPVGAQSVMDVMSLGHPLVLATNEGFVIRASVPATGTWTAGFTIHWTEVATY